MKQPMALLLLAFAGNALATPLIEPLQLISDHTLPAAQLQAQVLAAKRYDSFWNTGDEALAKQALASDFTDMTLPAGRIQGIRGALQASKTFRQAIPDLRCEVAQMISPAIASWRICTLAGILPAVFRVNRERDNSLILLRQISIRSNKAQ